MTQRHVGFRVAAIAAALLFLQSSASAEDSPARPAGDAVQQLADRIDEHTAARWKKEGVQPAPAADDAEFLRRVYLHIAGTIPPVSVVREFLEDERPDKRRRVVDELLDGPNYVINFTTFWRKVLMPEAEADFQVRFLTPGFEGWLREKLTANTPYDELVREIVTLELDTGTQQPRNVYQRYGEATPLAFYQAKEVAPENLAAATSRMFLGIRIECAQCHDHPFDKWKRDDFWGYAAFFGGIERQGQNGIFSQVREIPDRRELLIPDTDRVVQALYLDGTQPRWRFRTGSRETLANWITSKENPYFAKSAANRMWGYLFGAGIVEPVDDFTDASPASHPELLNELAQSFAAQKFDLKFLIRAITASKTYQLSSDISHDSSLDPQLFAAMPVQGMASEQIYRSLSAAIGVYQQYQANNPYFFGGTTPEAEFMETFADDDGSRLDRQTTILQALALMNGNIVAGATNLNQSRTLQAVAEAPFLDTAGKVETLFLAALSRQPTPEETARLVKYVNEGGPKKDSTAALADVFWALLNSSEFLLIH